MSRRALHFAAVFAVALFTSTLNHAQNPAPTPPMGWSEWDAYGLTVTEADFKANAKVLAGMRQYGWQYVILDAGWYMEDPKSHEKENRKYVWDGNGRLIPAVNRFPSAAGGAGFKPLSSWLHARGLKLGIHVMLGIPRQAVTGNLPIAGSTFHAAEAADTTQTCSWDDEFFVARDNAAGQAYYDSVVKLYAGWGVDYIKLGCVSGHPFQPSEIQQIAQAIKKTGRPMVLCLSPGPPPQEYAEFVGKYAQMWRVSEEHWDFWTRPTAKSNFPVGLRDDFDLFAQWASFVKPGNWVDGDVLPDGWLAPRPAWGDARRSGLTQDEQRSEFTLWAFARAPLMEGANLTMLDSFTRGLMTDREVLDIDQQAAESHPLRDLPAGFEHVRAWEAQMDASRQSRSYFAFFNLDDKPVTLHAAWEQLGLNGDRHAASNVWDGNKLPPSEGIDVSLPAHGSTIYRVQ
jgi:alpha-galactosidase